MKLRHIYYLLFIVFIFTACGKELPLIQEAKTYKTETINIGNFEYEKLSGIINDSFYLSNKKSYYVDSNLIVNETGILAIEEGTTIFANNGAFILIERKGKIFAQGSESKPIVFTSIKEKTGLPNAGDWVGIHINGEAEVNERSSGLVLKIGKYGRLDDARQTDNSGIISYVRVQYAGEALNNDAGGLNFNGVGLNTQVNHIQTYQCKGGGIRIRGGSVKLSHCISTQTSGTGISWDSGWIGLGQYWVVNQTDFLPDTITLMIGKSSIVNNPPRSNPVLSNVTLYGFTAMESRGLRLTSATLGNLYNVIITNTTRGVRADFSVSEIKAKQLNLSNSVIYNNEINYFDNEESAASLFSNSDFHNSNDDLMLTNYIGSTNTNALDLSKIDGWFEPAAFIGGIQNEQNNWTLNWTKL